MPSLVFVLGLLIAADAGADGPYVLNLLSQQTPVSTERLTPLAGFPDQQAYITQTTIGDTTWHRLRLGFFPSRATAITARERVQPHYPGAWIDRASAQEYRQVSAGSGILPELTHAAAVYPPQAETGTASADETVTPPAGEPAWQYPAPAAGLQPPTATLRNTPATAAFDFDAPPKTRFQLTPDLSFGARLELEAQHEQEFDLDATRARDETTVEPLLSLSLSYTPGSNLQAYLNIEPSRRFVDDDRNRKDHETRLDLKQAFLAYSGLPGNATLKLGRQRFQDAREWLFDEELDGIRLFHAFSRFAAEFSASRRSDRDLVNDQDYHNAVNYVVQGRFAPDKDIETGLYVFAQDDREASDEDLLYLGFHAHGEMLDDLEFWLELAHLWGEAGATDIRAYGADLGATYVFDMPLMPSLTLGYAYGSGDDNPADGRDGNFRQTGLQDNTAKFNGLVRLKYYGEMLDPELSNLQVATAGLGIRPTRSLSLDLVYHDYRQVEAAAQAGDWEIRPAPDGLSTDIGYGIDLVAGYRIKPHHKGSLIIGQFRPGKAFPADAEEAWYAELELQYEF